MHMHSETYTLQQIRRKRERGQRMANARWAQERQRRDALAARAAVDPLSVPDRILQRVIVINDGVTAHEIIRWASTSQREWLRLKQSVNL